MSKHAIDAVAEKSVALSFTSIGPRLRRRLFGWTPLEQYDLSGQVVVLTGGTSGIGEKAAELYASLGATLVIVARNPDKTARVIDELRQITGNNAVTAVIADLGKMNEVRRAAAELADRHPHIDVLAHNAGALFNTRKRTDDGTRDYVHEQTDYFVDAFTRNRPTVPNFARVRIFRFRRGRPSACTIYCASGCGVTKCGIDHRCTGSTE